MSKTKRGWLAVAAVLAVGMSGMVRAESSGGGDSGDNGMNPMYGNSYATLEGQGHNAGTPSVAPEGAFAVHETGDPTTTPLIDKMRQTQARMADQARHNWDAMVAKAHAMTQNMRTSLNTQAAGIGTATVAPGDHAGAGSNSDATASTPGSGIRIAPVNPKGAGPTIVGPSAG